MPDNPYSNLFGNDYGAEKPNSPSVPMAEDCFAIGNTVEPLDVIKEQIASFKKNADEFSIFLSKTRAVDHLIESKSAPSWLSIFIDSGPHISKGGLTAEKAHYFMLQKKFSDIITRMKELAMQHLEVIKRFNADIDQHYYSIDKTQETVNIEIKSVIEQIQLQRRILGAAARDLGILEGAMEANEARLKRFIDFGGQHNLSSAEFAMLMQTRTEMTTGFSQQFNYAFFDMMLIDKLAIRFDIYLKKTTAQYLQDLGRVLDQSKQS